MKGAKIALFPNKTAILSGQYLEIGPECIPGYRSLTMIGRWNRKIWIVLNSY